MGFELTAVKHTGRQPIIDSSVGRSPPTATMASRKPLSYFAVTSERAEEMKPTRRCPASAMMRPAQCPASSPGSSKTGALASGAAVQKHDRDACLLQYAQMTGRRHGRAAWIEHHPRDALIEQPQ